MSSNRAYTDPFEVLGLPSSASRDDVKRAFRQLALRCHPDVDGSPQAAARFSEVKTAADAILKGVSDAKNRVRCFARFFGWAMPPT